MSRSITLFAVSLALLIANTNGQVVMTFMYGQTNGLTGKGFGAMDGAPRDITTPPALLDAAIIKDSEIQSGTASPCGRTIMSGKLDVKKSLDKSEDGGLPDVGQNGKIKLVAHVINPKGSGPFICGIDTNANGNTFATIPVTVNVPANAAAAGKPVDYSLEAQLPQGTKCQGGADGQTCIVRCTNGNAGGPFGGCMAFTQMQGLFNDPAPAGSGPTTGFQLDRITENPVTREPNLFDDAKAKLSPKDLQALTPPIAKGKRRALLQLRR
ncbi:hypothetical protein MJO28_014948 [Puccinia striiformis f. sp. tritici]|uniref:Secreted protein n=2 Tax=Puccinia striiformis f. sp. tritici TaxID=168172 RepID=A0A0L0VE65_9BASI|nr:hypothetical protein Pst134EA_027809 [Puccinia striiformis f. sp. tritici]KAI9608084.1 hypothetical protein H4Q26_005539 [Puccinia striiformis f. sp. tritici PST-130]KNE97568.1 hypothetical protein, variant [Puccinia striiformis f. sp. tritici PST-78]KAH9442109.1 hypothetical protein Pst134EB_028377 [Puccinia striiformis f. sp. tritici]KAH9448498.1 hypothetical protein Pst134EA_027809 [Puccinia striiformis f. sp. tritici]KAI7937401.1 hypothetical protein MJO29_014716 [Puccinia striiformis f